MTNQSLTQEYLKEILHYNPDTGIFIWKVNKAKNVKAGSVAGQLNKTYSYRQIKIDGHLYQAHRLSFHYMTGEIPKEVDHINHIKDDNRWQNLREVTRRENQMNQLRPSNNTSGVMGVGPHKPLGKWYAKITVNWKQLHIGCFTEKWDAICARKSAENKYGFHPNHGG